MVSHDGAKTRLSKAEKREDGPSKALNFASHTLLILNF